MGNGKKTPARKKKKDWITAGEQREAIKKTDWLWYKWIPNGHLTFLFGEPDTGKSVLAMPIIASITKAEPWPNNATGLSDPRPVIWCETEGMQALNSQRLVDFGIPDDLVLFPNTEDPDFQLESKALDCTVVSYTRDDNLGKLLWNRESGVVPCASLNTDLPTDVNRFAQRNSLGRGNYG